MGLEPAAVAVEHADESDRRIEQLRCEPRQRVEFGLGLAVEDARPMDGGQALRLGIEVVRERHRRLD